MSFVLSSTKTPVKHLFPETISSKLQGHSNDKLLDVPPTYQDVADWAVVVPKPNTTERARSLVVVYKQPLMSTFCSIQPVTLRLQGVLGRHNLSTFGTWDRTIHGAVAAVQYLKLSSPGDQAIWLPTTEAVKNIRRLIHATVGGDERSGTTNDEMYMQRRVFTKITGRNANEASVLNASDDIAGLSNAVEPHWRVTRKLQLGRWDSDHEMVASSAAAFAVGDLVDVAVTCDIVVRRSDAGRKIVRVHLNLEHVLQVAAGYSAKSKGEDIKAIPSVVPDLEQPCAFTFTSKSSADGDLT